MKLFLVKIGKAYKTLKKNGFLNGIKIIWMYSNLFSKNFFGIGSGDILFISGGIGDSAFYRTSNQAEELEIHGFKCSKTIIDNPFLLSYVKKFKIFIFHRTIFTERIAAMISEIKKQGKEIIFETDDLVFDAELFHATDSYKSMNALEKKQYEKGVGEEIISDPYVKVCTTTTVYLGRVLEKYGKKVFISRNKFSNHELEVANNILENIPKEKYEGVRIGYFSGTSSHNKDFASIVDALMDLLEKYPEASLFIAGYLDVEHKLNKYKDRIFTLPFVPRDKYYENIWKVDINLAPLVKDDPFCESKSEIKFTETGILKIRTVAVRNETFSGAIEDGADGFLADNTQEWVEKIGRLVEDENLRKVMGEKAREKILRDYTNKNSHNEEYYDYLRSQL